MLSRSCFNLLNIDDYFINQTAFIPRLISNSGAILSDCYSSSSDEASSSSSTKKMKRKKPQTRVIVANQLPLKASKDPNNDKDWIFEWDKDALVLQLKDGFPENCEVVYIGCLSVDIAESDQDEIAQMLLESFKCVPTFLPVELNNLFYHGFCKHNLWPLFHYMLPMTANHGVRFDKSMWQAYVSANKIFADKIMEVINPADDFVWIHDYHLMILPTFLRKRFHRVKLGFFLHSPFPSSEIYRSLPVREEILRAMLNCDLIGFHTFDYARHFLSCCSRMLGLEYKSKRGYIGLDYYGRTVSIKILPVGVHLGQTQSIMALPDTAEKIIMLKETYKGKTVLLGVDDMDMFKGLSLKLMAFGLLLDENPRYRGNVVLVQIINEPRSLGNDIREVQDEVGMVVKEVNRKYGDESYQPIVCVNGPVSFQDKVAYLAISECVVVNAVRDGMNLVPYKYTLARQGCPELDIALGVEGVEISRQSVIIVSEFIGCSPSLSGAIRVNPWDISSIAEGMASGIMMSNSEKEVRHEKHYKYITSHDVAYWARSFDQDLQRACSDHYNKRCWGIGFGLNSRVVALGPNFRKISLEHIDSAYNQADKRLILLDYDGTMMPQDRVDKSPCVEVISVLNGLCSDPKNTVFIVSGRGRDTLAKWFSECERLGLSAEHGYFTRWNQDSEWETSKLAVDSNWKKIVLPVMEHYTDATDGSSIERKESAMVWHYQEADPDFGSWQGKELLDHLESVLANEPVVVNKGQQIVEVKPQGVSKGLAVKNLIETIKKQGKPAEFVLCIGDDKSDEDMFEAIANSVTDEILSDTAEVFACTVGQKPSFAKYYLDDTYEVIKMLEGLADASSQSHSKAKRSENGVVTFEGSSSSSSF